MKIIGGKLKGRNFFMPKDIKPTQNLVRKAIFDIIGQDLEGLAFLDLFAGSGAVGLEAYSRGATVTLVENDRFCAKVIGENLKLFGLDQMENPDTDVTFVTSDAMAMIKDLARRKCKYDIVFLDPPYGRGLAKKALKTLEGYDILHPNSYIIIEHNKRETLPDLEGRFLMIKQKKYGTSIITIYKSHQITKSPDTSCTR